MRLYSDNEYHYHPQRILLFLRQFAIFFWQQSLGSFGVVHIKPKVAQQSLNNDLL